MRTLILCNDRSDPVLAALLEQIGREPGFEKTDVALLDRAEATLRESNPDLILVLLAADQAESTLDVVRHVSGDRRLLVIGPATNPKLILRAMQAGAELFLDQAELKSEMESAIVRLRVRRTLPERPSQLIAVLSAAGGCGASTVAVNLAALLAKEHGQSNLIDLNSGKADLAPLLDLKPQYTLADLCRNDGRLDRSMYEKLLCRHSCGIGLLAAPRDYDEVRAVTQPCMVRALAVARETFSDVVVDLANCHDDEQLYVLEQSTRIFLVTRLDFTAIRNTRRMLDHFLARRIPLDRVEVVVNQFDLPNQLPLAEAEEAIGCLLANLIPADAEAVHAASNVGSPVALTRPDAAAVRAMGRLIGIAEPVPQGPNLLARARSWCRETLPPLYRALRERLKRAVRPKEPTEPDRMKAHHEPVPAADSGSVVRTLSI
jgi:pilus assembly protein CpaE